MGSPPLWVGVQVPYGLRSRGEDQFHWSRATMRHLPISLLVTAAIFPVTSAAHAQGQEQSAGFGALKRTFDMTTLAGTLPNTMADDGIRAAAFIDGLLYVASNGSQTALPLGNDNNESGIYIVDPATTVLIGWFSVADTFNFI